MHRKIVLPDGVTFRTERAEKEGEFLASPDNWFRPVNIGHGPDGALYICDMYREYIEHPAVIPESVKRHLDMTSGKDRGRIWRVTKEGAPRGERPRLGKASTDELVSITGKFASDHEYVLHEGAEEVLRAVLDGAVRGEGFGNARFARTLFEQALNAQALSLSERLDTAGPDELTALNGDDLADAARALGEEPARSSLAAPARVVGVGPGRCRCRGAASTA